MVLGGGGPFSGFNRPPILKLQTRSPLASVESIAAASSGDGDVLLAINFVGRGRRIGSEAGLETPQLLASLGIEGAEISIGAAMENQPAAGGQDPASEAGEIWDFLLPYLLVGARIERGDQTILASALDGTRVGEVELARGNFGGEEQISRLWIVSAGRPIAGGGWLSDLRVAPFRREHAAALISFHRLGALRRGWIAGGNGLRGDRLLPRLLRNRLLFDIDAAVCR